LNFDIKPEVLYSTPVQYPFHLLTSHIKEIFTPLHQLKSPTSAAMESIKTKVKGVVNGSHKTDSGEGKTALITGGSSFVAAHVLTAFLSRGYNVRAIARSQETAEKVKKSQAKYLS
jgi:hypothetical protein